MTISREIQKAEDDFFVKLDEIAQRHDLGRREWLDILHPHDIGYNYEDYVYETWED